MRPRTATGAPSTMRDEDGEQRIDDLGAEVGEEADPARGRGPAGRACGGCGAGAVGRSAPSPRCYHRPAWRQRARRRSARLQRSRYRGVARADDAAHAPAHRARRPIPAVSIHVLRLLRRAAVAGAPCWPARAADARRRRRPRRPRRDAARAAGRPARRRVLRPRRAHPVPALPGDNAWNTPRRQAAARSRTPPTTSPTWRPAPVCTPTSAPCGTAPRSASPTWSSRRPAQGADRLRRVRRRERPRSVPDARRTRRWRAPAAAVRRRRPPRARPRRRPPEALRALPRRQAAGRLVERRLRRRLRSHEQRAAPGRLDHRRRGRPADPPRASCATTRSSARACIDHALRFTVATTQRRLRLPGDALRQRRAPIPTCRRWACACGSRRASTSAASRPRSASILAGAQDLRHDGRRQRLRLVRERRARPALGRRRPARPRPGQGQRLRGRRLARAACRAPSSCRCRRRRARATGACGARRGSFVDGAAQGGRRRWPTATARPQAAHADARPGPSLCRTATAPANRRYTVTVTVRDDRGRTASRHPGADR